MGDFQEQRKLISVAKDDGESDEPWSQFADIGVKAGDVLGELATQPWTWRALCGRQWAVLVRCGQILRQQLTRNN